MNRPPTLAAGEHAYQEIRAGILRGDYPPAMPMVEADLAEALSVSRTPVRQALQTLLQEELLEAGPRRQLLVAGVPPERRQEIFRLRRALEEIAVQEACERLTDDDLDQLRLTLFRQQRAARDRDIDAFLDADDAMHLTLARGACMPMLVRFLSQLRAFVRIIGRDALRRPGRLDQVLAEHETILRAVEARNKRAALTALRAHLAATEGEGND